MAGDLTLTQRSPGDLRLPKYRAADLVLTQSGPADLVLRHPGIPRVRLQAALPQLVSLLKIQAEEAGTPVRLQATLPPPVSLMKAAYDNAVWRGVAQGWRLPSEAARSQHRPICAPHRQSPTLHTGSRASWADAGREYARLCALWRQNVHVRVRSCAPHDDATPTRDHLCAPWISLARLRQTRCAPWQQTTPTRKPPACFDWLDLRRTRQHACSSWAAGTPRSVSACAPHRQAARVRHAYCWPWGHGVLRYGWGGPVIPPEPPQPPEPPCPPPGPGDLVLVQNRDGTLVLRRCVPGPQPPGQIVVPIRRVYVMSNSASLIRVSDGTAIPVLKLTAAIDARSWVWSLSAEVPLSAQSVVENDGSGPVELEATVNGHSWRFLAENLRRNRAFGSKSLSVSGRGIAAALDAPYAIEQAFENTTDRTAVQLMEDVLTINGVPMGWAVDATAITDWLVTAGAWSHYGSHISAINTIAGSIDALVQAHRTDKTLLIQPRYPVLPWKWATDVTPDIILPEDVIVQEGLEWLDKPDYNGVYVSGQNQGILGQIKITGTAGDAQAPMVTDPLITHADAARQRGEAVLGDTGRQQRLTLSMPIGGDTALPVILPNQFIEYGPQQTIGLVRGVRVDASRPQYRQFVDVEVHL